MTIPKDKTITLEYLNEVIATKESNPRVIKMSVRQIREFKEIIAPHPSTRHMMEYGILFYRGVPIERAV